MANRREFLSLGAQFGVMGVVASTCAFGHSLREYRPVPAKNLTEILACRNPDHLVREARWKRPSADPDQSS